MKAAARRLAAVLAVILATFVLSTPPAFAGGPDNEDCADAPTPEYTGRGMSGTMDPPGTDALPKSVYGDYNYAGQIWNLYDNVDDTLGVCFDPGGTIENWLGSQMFNVAKVTTALANMTQHAINRGGLSDQIDHGIAGVARHAYNGIGVPFIPLALLLMGVVMLVYATRGDNARIVGAGGRTLAMLFVVSMALSPLVYTAFADRILFGGVKDAQSAMVNALYAKDAKGADPADVPPTKLEQAVVYNNWLRGEFGDINDPMAKKYGRMLLDGQAYTYTQTNSKAAHDDHVKQNKNKEFIHVASEMHDKGDYATFTGRSGRVGPGFIAMVQGLTVSLFSGLNNLCVLLAQLLIRGMVLLAPLIGFACLIPGRARAFGKALLTFMAIGFIATVVSIYYLYVVLWIQSQGLPIGLELVCTTAWTLFVWAFVRPFKRLKSIVSTAVDATGAQPQINNIQEKMRRWWPKGRDDQDQGRWWHGNDRREQWRFDQVPPGGDEPLPGGPPGGGGGRGPGGGPRPEGRQPFETPYNRRRGLPPPDGRAPSGGPSPAYGEPGGPVPLGGRKPRGELTGQPVPMMLPATATRIGDGVRAESARANANPMTLDHHRPRAALPAGSDGADGDVPERRAELVVPSQMDRSGELSPAARTADGAHVITSAGRNLYVPSDDPAKPSALPTGGRGSQTPPQGRPEAAPVSGPPRTAPTAPAASQPPAQPAPARPARPTSRPVGPPPARPNPPTPLHHQGQGLNVTPRRESPPPPPARPESATRPPRPNQ